MKDKTFSFSYPADSGFKGTDIHFYTGTPDLQKIFFNTDEKKSSQRLFVTDTTLSSLPALKNFIDFFTDSGDTSIPGITYGKCGTDILAVIGAGEKFKTMDSILSIESVAIKNNFNRNCTFIAIGGGVMSDMVAFAASIFKRGVSVDFVPTTLLSMVDASIGGKTGVDFSNYKNMVGTFWPAKNLHVWPDFVKTLPEKEFRSGLGEAIKTALLFNEEMLNLFRTEKDKVLARDSEIIGKVIFECAKAKAIIVEEDLREHGRRAFLNLGHTFGHALESVAGLGDVTHGAAVMWGIGRALDLSERLSLCTKEYAESCKELFAAYGYDMNPVPEALKSFGENRIRSLIEAMRKDKKNQSSEIRLTLQKGLCDTVIQTASDSDIEAVLA